jgi:hypothetical protein
MIEYLTSSIFDSPAKVLVNPVNTSGVMGKGLALEFKKRFPEMFIEYIFLCKNPNYGIGSLALWTGINKSVLLFPTKIDWKEPSRLAYIERGLIQLSDFDSFFKYGGVSFPKLGCGLDWKDVQPLMELYLFDKHYPVYIHI